MKFGKWDMMIFVTMSIAIISMSFVFPALGLSGQEQNESDIPEFNMSADRFDFAGEFPEDPGQPSNGFLKYDMSLGSDSDNQVWLNGDTSDGTDVTIISDENPPEQNITVTVNNWENNSLSGDDTYDLNEVGDKRLHENNSYEILFTYQRVENRNQSDERAIVEYQVRSQPSDTSWYDRIPVVGAVFGAGDHLAAILGWIGSVIYWTFGTMWSTILNLLGIAVDIVVYVFSMIYWLTSTYGDVVTSAESFASVFLAVPGILLGLELGKIGLLLVHIIWIG